MNAHTDREHRSLADRAAVDPPACDAGAASNVDAGADADAGRPAAAQRHVWHGRYGAMVIEVRESAVFVNGAYVEPAPPPAGRQPG